MNSAVEHILLKDQISEDDLRLLDRACKDDPSLTGLIRHWAALTSHVRESLEQDLPDSRVLVLFALSKGETEIALTRKERSELEAAEVVMTSALEKHPAVEFILDRIRSDVGAFEESWSEAVAPSRTTVDLAPLRKVRLPVPFQRLSVRQFSLGLAAVVVVLVTSMILVRQVFTDSEGFIIRAPEESTHVVNLPDGSSVRLMPGSAITFNSDETFDRQLSLQGNAFFDVTPGEVQFRVSTENAVTSVYGTSFGISSNDEASLTEVVLVSGSISLASLGPDTNPVMLSQGQYSRVIGADLPSAPMDVDLQQALAWTNLFIFRDTPLSVVIERLMDSYEVSIAVDKNLIELTITGTFAREQGVVSILDAIATALGVRIEEGSDTGSYRVTS
ncbi:MAG: hypothetical protein BMS9Abin05_1973 [Rhodothermia bacterium]|nr:MAG: hypothetical protein BMS9Abin05_1973 [Rhodothermia bacterium]